MAQVQKNSGAVNGVTSIVTSLGSATTAGNSILLMVTSAGTLSTPAGFTSRSPQVNLLGQYLFDKLVASGNSTDTPTLTQGGAYNATWQIVEYSGITGFVTSSGSTTSFNELPPNTTASITPTTGNRLLVAFASLLGSGSSTIFTAGDPTDWTNSFTGEQSSYAPYTSGAGRDALAGGWASRQVTTAGATAYSTDYSWTPFAALPATTNIIAAYTHTAGGTAYILAAAAGTLTLSGQAATLSYGRNTKLAASLGTLTLSGQTAALLYGRNRTITAGLGTITMLAPAIGLTYSQSTNKTMPAGIGFMRLDGQPVTFKLTYRPIACGLGTLTLAGQIVALRYGRSTGTSTGTLTLAGQAMAWKRSYGVRAEPGVITLSGQAALTRGRKMTAAHGVVTLTGQAVLLKRGRGLGAAVGTITLSGKPVNLNHLIKLHHRMQVVPSTIYLSSPWLEMGRSGTEQPGRLIYGQTVVLKKW